MDWIHQYIYERRFHLFFMFKAYLTFHDTSLRLTSNMIKDRLLKEAESNVTLTVKNAADSDSFEVMLIYVCLYSII